MEAPSQESDGIRPALHSSKLDVSAAAPTMQEAAKADRYIRPVLEAESVESEFNDNSMDADKQLEAHQ